MRTSILSLLAVVFAAFSLAACTTSDGAVASSDCFYADRIVGWETHDGRSLDVTDTRGDHYRIQFCNRCSGLSTAVTIDFEGGLGGRMCGNADEVVRIRGASCRISSVMRVSPQAEELDAVSCE